MSDPSDPSDQDLGRDFEALASAPRRSALADLVAYLGAHKKWWLAPLLLVLLLFAGLLLIGASGGGPLVYSFF